MHDFFPEKSSRTTVLRTTGHNQSKVSRTTSVGLSLNGRRRSRLDPQFLGFATTVHSKSTRILFWEYYRWAGGSNMCH